MGDLGLLKYAFTTEYRCDPKVDFLSNGEFELPQNLARKRSLEPQDVRQVRVLALLVHSQSPINFVSVSSVYLRNTGFLLHQCSPCL